jgi:hypothetical protein
MNRPTLEEQIRISKMTDKEAIKALAPERNIDLWIHRHCSLLWHIIHWNWFDIWEGTEDADKYRSREIKLKRKLFGGNK